MIEERIAGRDSVTAEGGASAGWEKREVSVAGRNHARVWGIATESPIQISINGVPWTVLMATPCDLEDLAIGLALTERLLPDAQAVTGITVSAFLHDATVDLTTDAAHADSAAPARRSLISNSSCGLCGLESLAQLQAMRSARAATHAGTVQIPDDAIAAAFTALPSHQPANRATHSMHAAAWCEPDGTIVLVREDIGRHNALDKLIGGLARSGRPASAGFIVMTSRCSYELVAKASVINAHLLATISAPTTMALEWASALDLSLACVTSDGIVRFDEPTHAA